jgi:hypothetical protein
VATINSPTGKPFKGCDDTTKTLPFDSYNTFNMQNLSFSAAYLPLGLILGEVKVRKSVIA